MGIVAEWGKGLLESQAVLLKGLVHKLTHPLPELHDWGSGSKSDRGPWGGAELSAVREGARRVVFSRTQVLAEAIAPIQGSPCQSWQVCTVSASPSSWLMPFTLPW